MLTPVAVATWIAFCVPWAEPRLLAALVDAGSAGEPFLISDSEGWREAGDTLAQGISSLRERLKRADVSSLREKPVFVGLTQIPVTALAPLGLSPVYVVDKCTNLEIGYSLFLDAYIEAGKREKTPWKQLAAAYNYYRTGQLVIETPYSKRATDYLMAGKFSAPATMTDPVYHAVVAEWGAGLASRHGMRQMDDAGSVLRASAELAQRTRTRY